MTAQRLKKWLKAASDQAAHDRAVGVDLADAGRPLDLPHGGVPAKLASTRCDAPGTARAEPFARIGPGASRMCRSSLLVMGDMFCAGFDRDGFAVARQLFSRAEARRYRGHFMALHRGRPRPREAAGAGLRAGDPLRRYPRMMQMHRWDPVSLQWLLDPRICDRLLAVLGRPPAAVQTMCYFKPPGSRGQALHQDNFFLRARPGTCVAAWLALDRADEANGCLLVVPGSHRWPVLCTIAADTKHSFTDVTVPLPPGTRPRPVPMEPGDMVFFNGSLVHGSNPNRTARRFRRALIGHYIEAGASQVAGYYHPALAMDGTPLRLGVSEGGGPCGQWAGGPGGRPVIEMTGLHPDSSTRQ
jgi:phytanoyl-CoA hydroxylase